MKAKHVKIFLLLTVVEGILAVLFFLSKPSDPESAKLFGFSYLKLGLLGVDFLFLILLSGITIAAFLYPAWLDQITNRITPFLTAPVNVSGKRLFVVQGGLIVAMVAILEAYFLTWFSIPQTIRPFLLWAALICFQAWVILRIGWRTEYKTRPTLISTLRSIWRKWTPVQRHVFWILSGIGLVYFLAFIPANLHWVHVDENIILPDVVKMLLPGGTFKETLQRWIINENWWYGQPYLPISALALVIPRLIYGVDFVNQKAINLLFLRQLVSVLPMIMAISLLVYVVTRFKSMLYSIGMFVFLLLVPGVVKYCYHFWHPDSLILLLVVLTIFFLQRDRLKFGKNFYLAAVTCGLAAAIKLWGFFFFLAVAGYLVAGMSQKVLTFKRAATIGLLFILVMALTIVLSSPSLFVPWSFQFMVHGLQTQNASNTQGYNEADPEGVYHTGLANWLRYFQMFYMQKYFFFFAFASLMIGSLAGSQAYLNRLLLAWCLVTAIYLVSFLAVKSFQYMLPLMVPLYSAGFLFPFITRGREYPRWLSFLGTPLANRIIIGITVLMLGSEFIFNLVSVVTSPAIGVISKI